LSATGRTLRQKSRIINENRKEMLKKKGILIPKKRHRGSALAKTQKRSFKTDSGEN